MSSGGWHRDAARKLILVKMVVRNRSRQDTLLGQRIPLKRIRVMAKDLPREEDQRGTRRVFMWGAVIAAAFFVALMIIFILGPS
jgi:hypothetical protein